MKVHQLRAILATLLLAHVYTCQAAPIDSQSILVSVSNSISQVIEFTRTETVLQSFQVPTPPGNSGTTEIGDIAMDRSGKIQIFNGAFSPYLTTLTPQPASGVATFANHTIAGWSPGESGIAIDEARNAIYANDETLKGAGDPNGIIRFDSTTYAATRHLSGSQFNHGDYTAVTLGQDGLLYASFPELTPGNNMLDVIDPDTFTILRTVTLPMTHSPTGTPVTFTGFAVDAQGNIYGTEGDDFGHGISKFSPDGTRVKFMTVNISFPWLHDLALSPDGNLVTLSQQGDVVMTNTALDSYVSFRSNLINRVDTYVAWAVATIPEPRTVWLFVFGGLAIVRTRHRSRCGSRA